MNKLLLLQSFSISLIALSAWAQDHSAVRPAPASTESQLESLTPQIPPELQHSSFFQDLNRSGEPMPTNFAGLIERFGGEFSRGGVPVLPVLVVPDGRSLQRREATFSDPRMLFHGGSSPLAINASDRVFMGYVSRANQIEVISWNEVTSQYDFFLIENFREGQVPRITVPNRALCMSCHQAGGPIFSRSPWLESTVHTSERHFPGNRLWQRMVQANGGSTVFGSIDLSMHRPSVSDRSRYDAAVREASLHLQVTIACRTMCGNNAECKQLLVASAFLPLTNEEQVRFQSILEERWPVDGYSQVSSVIPDRDPLASRLQGGQATRVVVTNPEAFYERAEALPMIESFTRAMRNGVRLADGIDITYDEHSATAGDVFLFPNSTRSREFSRYARLERYGARPGSAADPATPRPRVNAIPRSEAAAWVQQHAALCLGLHDVDIETADRYSPEELRRALLGPSVRKSFASHQPFNRIEFMNVLLASIGVRDIPACYRTDAIHVLPREQVATLRQSIQAAQATNFVRHCQSCHSTGSAVVIPFENIEELRSPQWSARILQRLRTQTMPPQGATPHLSTEDRAALIQLLSR